MNINFENRERYNLKTAMEISKRPGSIKHILHNDDNTYSVMSHINCEHCDYCDENNQWWENKKSQGLTYDEIFNLSDLKPIIHIPKSDPYEQQKILMPENYQ